MAGLLSTAGLWLAARGREELGVPSSEVPCRRRIVNNFSQTSVFVTWSALIVSTFAVAVVIPVSAGIITTSLKTLGQTTMVVVEMSDSRHFGTDLPDNKWD